MTNFSGKLIKTSLGLKPEIFSFMGPLEKRLLFSAQFHMLNFSTNLRIMLYLDGTLVDRSNAL